MAEREDDFDRQYVCPPEGTWMVYLRETSGSAMDGTLRHWWSAMKAHRAVRRGTLLYASEEDAWAAADRLTQANEGE